MPVLWLAVLSACDDTTFNSHVMTVEGEGFEAVVEVFESNCVSCHMGANATAGVQLDGNFCETTVDVDAMSGSGLLIVAGDKENSVLYQRIIDEMRPMPPGGVMSESNIEIVGQWIDAGADCSQIDGDSGQPADDTAQDKVQDWTEPDAQPGVADVVSTKSVDEDLVLVEYAQAESYNVRVGGGKRR